MVTIGTDLFLNLQSPYEILFCKTLTRNWKVEKIPLPKGINGIDELSSRKDKVYLSTFTKKAHQILEYRDPLKTQGEFRR